MKRDGEKISMLFVTTPDEAHAASAAGIHMLSIEGRYFDAAMREAAGDCFVQVGLPYGVLATTDDPCDDLSAHATIAAASDVQARVLPTYRPDRYTEPAAPDFPNRVRALLQTAGVPGESFASYLEAHRERRRTFIEHGARAADHGVDQPVTASLSDDHAERLFRDAMQGRIARDDVRLWRALQLRGRERARQYSRDQRRDRDQRAAVPIVHAARNLGDRPPAIGRLNEKGRRIRKSGGPCEVLRRSLSP